MVLSFILYIFFTFVELNCENLFDYRHDEGKEDFEYLPESGRHWTKNRYWRKQNHIGQEILSCSEQIPDMIALCEVENDSVLNDLTKRSLLRNAGYEYIMTSSPDTRGIDVALLYSPFSFRPFRHYSLRVDPVKSMRPTRDILYVCGEIISGDTLHVFVMHAPSRYGGKRPTRKFRWQTAYRLNASVDSILSTNPRAHIIVAGDFNDEPDDEIPLHLESIGLHNITRNATGSNGAKGTYKYDGCWSRIDHVFVSNGLSSTVEKAYINDLPFLLEEDTKYGGLKPFRTYNGYRYQQGFSDHLPVVVRFKW